MTNCKCSASGTDEEMTIDSREHGKFDTSRTVQNRGIDETQTNLTGRNRFETRKDPRK